MIKTKEDIINLILENSEKYLEGSLSEPSLDRDIYLSTRKLKLKWDRPIADFYETQKVRKKVNVKFKALSSRKEKNVMNDFIGKMIGGGLPKNTFYTNADFGFDFKKNKFELSINDEPFKGEILCLGTDEHYDYYVISPDFKGVRKVFHDVGEIEDIDFDSLESFAKTAIKFGLIQGCLEKGLIDKNDINEFFDKIENIRLKEIVQENILN